MKRNFHIMILALAALASLAGCAGPSKGLEVENPLPNEDTSASYKSAAYEVAFTCADGCTVVEEGNIVTLTLKDGSVATAKFAIGFVDWSSFGEGESCKVTGFDVCVAYTDVNTVTTRLFRDGDELFVTFVAPLAAASELTIVSTGTIKSAAPPTEVLDEAGTDWNAVECGNDLNCNYEMCKNARERWAALDFEGDGVANGDEDKDGDCEWHPGANETNWIVSDTDGDGQEDGAEVKCDIATAVDVGLMCAVRNDIIDA